MVKLLQDPRITCNLLPSYLAALRDVMRRVSDRLLSETTTILFQTSQKLINKHIHDARVILSITQLLKDLINRMPATTPITHLKTLEPKSGAPDQEICTYMQLLGHGCAALGDQYRASSLGKTFEIWSFFFGQLLQTQSYTVVHCAIEQLNVFSENIIRQSCPMQIEKLHMFTKKIIQAFTIGNNHRWLEILAVSKNLIKSVPMIKRECEPPEELKKDLCVLLGKVVLLHKISPVLARATDAFMGAVFSILDARLALGFIRLDCFTKNSSTGSESSLSLQSQAQRQIHLLEVLRRNLSHDYLAYFIDDMIPLLRAYKARTEDILTLKTGRVSESSPWNILYKKIWELMPNFLLHPKDFSEIRFRMLTKHILSFLNDNRFRSISCKALENIVKSAKNGQNEVICTALQWVSKLVLPKLCNLLKQTDLDYVAQTIRAVVQVSEPCIVQEVCRTIETQLFMNTVNSSVDSKGLIQVALSVTPGLPQNTIREWIKSGIDILSAHARLVETQEKIMDSTGDNIAWLNACMEKQFYHLLSELLEKLEGSCIEPPLVEKLIQHIKETSHTPFQVSSRKFRVLVILRVIKLSKSSLDTFTKIVIPELVLCTQEICSRTRERALDAVVILANRFGPLAFLRQLQIGFVSNSPRLVSGTLFCVAMVYWTYYSLLPEETHRTIWSVAIFFSQAPEKKPELALQIRNAVFSFLDMLLELSTRHNTTASLLQSHKEKLLSNVFCWVTSRGLSSTNNASNVKLRVASSTTRQFVRTLLEKMFTRWGIPNVTESLPLNARRYGKYVQKQMKRKARQAICEETLTPISPRKKRERMIKKGKEKLGTFIFTEGTRDESDKRQESLVDFSNEQNLLRHLKIVHKQTTNHKIQTEGNSDKNSNVPCKKKSSIYGSKRSRECAAVSLKRVRNVADIKKDTSPFEQRSSKVEPKRIVKPRKIKRTGRKQINTRVEKTGWSTMSSEYSKDPTIKIKLKRQNMLKRYPSNREESLIGNTPRSLYKKISFFSRRHRNDMNKSRALQPYAYIPLDRKYLNKRFQRENRHRFEMINPRAGKKRRFE